MNNKQLIEELEKRDVTQYVGSIQLSDKVIVSDPCYDYSTWCQSILDNVLAGNYKCFVKSVETEWDDRIGELIIYHENYSDYPKELISCDISVDSGQAGFFDYEYFKSIKDQNEEKKEKWYQAICELTTQIELNPEYKSLEQLQKEHFPNKKIEDLTIDETSDLVNIINKQDKEIPRIIESWSGNCKDNKCVVSSSGFGDGCYDLYIHKNDDDKIVSMRINYIE